MTSRFRIDGVSRFPSRLEVGEHLGDDPRRAHPAHAAEQDGGGRLPAEQQPERRTRDEVRRPRRRSPGTQSGAEAAAQLVGRVLEPEREQEQQHTDLGDERR